MQSTTPASRAQDLAVFGFCELWGLVFGLPPGEDLYHGAPMTARMFTFLSIGAAFAILGPTWPLVKRRFPLAWLLRISTDFGYWLFALGLLSLWFQISSIRSDMDIFVMPRTVTPQQSQDLNRYLTERPKGSVIVKFNPLDQEAAEYGSALFNILKLSGWDASIDTSTQNPLPQNGLCTAAMTESAQNTTAAIIQAMQKAFHEASIPLNCNSSAGSGPYKLYLLVGKRPLILKSPERSIFTIVGNWVASFGD